MFEFSRELKRFFTVDGPKDGLTGGDAPLLELLDLELLHTEARASAIAAGRISAKDPAQRSLEAARVWRELARRTGDAVALRKAAALAECATDGFEHDGRLRNWASARLEQAVIAITGADLFGDEGLNAAAEYALDAVVQKAPDTASGAVAAGQLVRLKSQAFLRTGDAPAVLAAAQAYDGPIAMLESRMRGRAVGKFSVVDLRCDRGELLLAGGSRLRDTDLLSKALAEFDALALRLDAAYEPISWARVQELRGAALTALGETRGDLDGIADGVAALADAIDMVGSHHSLIDWARLQHSLAGALRALGEVTDSEKAFDQATSCYDRALWALKSQPAVTLRATAASNRAAVMARRAELTGDLEAIEEAVGALRADLVGLSPAKDPVVWAVCQVNLARLYEARTAVSGASRDDSGAAAVALSAALDVFGEHGLRTLADDAARALERLAARNRAEI